MLRPVYSFEKPEKRPKENLNASSLENIPYAAANNICTKNFKTSCGSKMLSSYQPPFDAHVISLLQNKGAVITRKTDIEEFGIGFFSSAGKETAAAVADENVSFAIGSDSRGELRTAAAYCGITAIKPSYGRLSRWGLIDHAPSMESIGIAGSKTNIIAQVLEAVSGEDPKDPTSLKKDVPPYSQLLNEKKEFSIAVPRNWSDIQYIEEDIQKNFLDYLDKLKSWQQNITFIDIPTLNDAYTAAAVITAVEAFSNLANYDGVRFGFRERGEHLQDMYVQTRTKGFSSKTKKFLTFGALISNEYYYEKYFLNAQKARRLINKELQECFQKYDLLLTPTMPIKTSMLESDNNKIFDPMFSYTAPANLAGLPALTFPVSINSSSFGGLNFTANYDCEETLLQISAYLEEVINNV